MKKPKKYVGDEEFELIKQAFNEAIAYERGERNNLRVTVRATPGKTVAKSRTAKKSLAEAIQRELANLSADDLRQVVEYIAFLKFQRRPVSAPTRKRPATRVAAVAAG